MYLFLWMVGAIGFTAMVALGFLHTGDGLHHHGHHGHHDVQDHGGGHPWFLITPLDVFSLALGVGAIGDLFDANISATALPFVALAGGLGFHLGIVRPLMRGLMKFASRPSDGLEGQVAQIAEASTRFDQNGRGVIRLELDGEVVQLLATLDSDERIRGIQVQKGDQLLVTEVDPTRNTCRVTREVAP